MRILKIMLVVLVMSVVGALSISCGPGSDTAVVTEEQLVTVQRGDLKIDITAVGNLAFSRQEELTFGAEGTVGEVLVGVDDSVEEGQVLAELDDTSITSLQQAVVQAKIDMRDAESVTELDIAQAEAAVAEAKVAVEAAQEALEEAEGPYTDSDIANAELAVINAEIALDRAQDNYEKAWDRYVRNRSVHEWAQDVELKQKELAIAEFNLTEAEETLAEMEAGADPLEVEQKQKQLALAQTNLKEAEDDLAELLGSADSLEVELKQSEVASAQAALDKAVERLEMTIMVASFAGIVTSVDVEEGDAVKADQVVIELVDPDKFETEILVSETDIFNIRLGAQATVQVDAMSGISLPATVIHISPMATIQSGVVNYSVTVELESVVPEVGTTAEEAEGAQEIPEGIDEVLDEAVAEGRISQEQADMMKERLQQFAGNLSKEEIEQFIERFSQGGPGFGQGQPSGARQLPAGAMMEAIQLREGLTVTVSIILYERNDVLLVPNSAISSSGGQTYVRVVSPDGIIEDRPVTTGISDWQYTEVISGLSEGEKVIVPEATGTSTTSQQGGGMPFFPRGEIHR